MTKYRHERTEALKQLTASYKEYEESRWKPDHLICEKRLSEAVARYKAIEAIFNDK